MIALFWLLLAPSVSPFKSKIGLAAENAALRHQLIVLQRRVRGRIQLTNGDRLFLVICIDGFHRSSRPSRSSVPRLSYVGIEPASVSTGGGNPALLEADRRSGTARADPPDGRPKSAMGGAAPFWRAAQARPSCRSLQRGAGHGPGIWSAVPRLVHPPS